MKRLVDSINDTARMARASLVLVMLVALYLFLTLLSSTDEQLLRESYVAVPQINIGVSIKTNYIVAPLIFLYLHIQTLFLLSVLARKIQGFIGRAEEERWNWNWLSAFVFVQLFRPIGEHLGITSQVRQWSSLILCLISIAVVPVLLLLAIVVSFVRYQNDSITNIHRGIFILDVIFVICFIIYIIVIRRGNISNTTHTREVLRNTMVFVIVEGSMLLLLVLFLLYGARPPQFGSSGTANGRVDVWKKSEDEDIPIDKKNGRVNAWKKSNAEDTSVDKKLYDLVLCDWMDNFCRYIDVNNKLLANLGMELPDDTGTKRIHAERLDLAERELRYACFRSAELYHVDLRSADLRGADFGSAEIHNSNFSKAKLHGAIFTDAKLKNGTDIGGAKLHRANLSGAKLSGAKLEGAELYGANLSKSKEIGTNKCVLRSTLDDDPVLIHSENDTENTILHGADLRFARLHGANLEGAELHGADLSYARLHGANLEGAELYGANLRNAELYGANLENVKLDGADLRNAKLAGSYGKPESREFVWIFNTSPSFVIPKTEKAVQRSKFIKYLVDRFEEKTGMRDMQIYYWKTKTVMKYEELLKESIKENSQGNFNMKPNEYDNEYWKSHAEWMKNFACQNKYIARSILKRWKSKIPLSDIEPENLRMAKPAIIEVLENMEEPDAKCIGLHALPDGERQELLRSIRSRIDLMSDAPMVEAEIFPMTDRAAKPR